MREIELNQGYVAFVDDDWYDFLSEHNWFVLKGAKTEYAIRNKKKHEGGRGTILMHRVVVGLPKESPLFVDHRDFNGLNNQTHNLRIATKDQNRQNNRLRKNNKTGYKGVYRNPGYRRWRATIWKDRECIHLGMFDTPEEAAKAYNTAAMQLYGEFACLNTIEG